MLIDGFMQYAKRDGGTDQAAVDLINTAHGTRYTLSQLYRWRGGSRPAPAWLAEWMRKTAGPWIVQNQCGPQAAELPLIDRLRVVDALRSEYGRRD